MGVLGGGLVEEFLTDPVTFWPELASNSQALQHSILKRVFKKTTNYEPT
jgi:hypothetical protein